MRLRRRELIRKHWRPLVRGLGIVLLVATVGITAAAVLFGSWMAWMIVGAVYATLLFAWMSGLEIIDSETRRYAQGADGEELTARQVRRRSRRGWRAVHNVLLESGDIDHIVVGPGGAVAIESKCPDAGWDWLSAQGIHRTWVRQARRSAMRAQALIRQHANVQTDAIPLLVVWASGLAGEHIEVDGVRILHGTELVGFLDALEPVLDEHQVRHIHRALGSAADGLEVAVQARRAATLARA